MIKTHITIFILAIALIGAAQANPVVFLEVNGADNAGRTSWTLPANQEHVFTARASSDIDSVRIRVGDLQERGVQPEIRATLPPQTYTLQVLGFQQNTIVASHVMTIVIEGQAPEPHPTQQEEEVAPVPDFYSECEEVRQGNGQQTFNKSGLTFAVDFSSQPPPQAPNGADVLFAIRPEKSTIRAPSESVYQYLLAQGERSSLTYALTYNPCQGIDDTTSNIVRDVEVLEQACESELHAEIEQATYTGDAQRARELARDLYVSAASCTQPAHALSQLRATRVLQTYALTLEEYEEVVQNYGAIINQHSQEAPTAGRDAHFFKAQAEFHQSDCVQVEQTIEEYYLQNYPDSTQYDGALDDIRRACGITQTACASPFRQASTNAPRVLIIDSTESRQTDNTFRLVSQSLSQPHNFDVLSLNEDVCEASSLRSGTVSEAQIREMLDSIAMAESGRWGYNAMNQGKREGERHPIIGSGHSREIIGQDLTSMTIREILQRSQISIYEAETNTNSGRIFAAGRYQIIPSTLRGLVNNGHASYDDLFSPQVQDRLGRQLLVGTRRAVRYIESGEYDRAQNSIALEWAGIETTRGGSHYGGQVANPEATRRLVRAMRGETRIAQQPTCDLPTLQRLIATCSSYSVYAYVSEEEFNPYKQGQYVFISAQAPQAQTQRLLAE